MFALNNHTRGQSVKSGAYQAFAWIFGIFWAILAGSGAMIVFTDTRLPRTLGWVALVTAAVIAFSTMRFWIRVLPGILGLATLNSMLSVWRGQAGVNSSYPIPRPQGIANVALLGVCTVLAARIAGRELTPVTRAALFGLVVSFGFAITSFPSIIGFALMTACLSVAEIYAGRTATRTPES